MIRANSSNVGGIPMMIMPKPITNNPSVKNKITLINKAATNFPFKTESLGIGCAIRRLSVPRFRSELIASKPKPIPSKGPRNDTNVVNGGKVPSDRVKIRKNKYELVVKFAASSVEFAVSEIVVIDVYNEPIQVKTMMANKIIIRQLVK